MDYKPSMLQWWENLPFPFPLVSFHPALFPLIESDRIVVGKTGWYGGHTLCPLYSLEDNFLCGVWL